MDFHYRVVGSRAGGVFQESSLEGALTTVALEGGVIMPNTVVAAEHLARYWQSEALKTAAGAIVDVVREAFPHQESQREGAEMAEQFLLMIAKSLDPVKGD